MLLNATMASLTWERFLKILFEVPENKMMCFSSFCFVFIG